MEKKKASHKKLVRQPLNLVDVGLDGGAAERREIVWVVEYLLVLDHDGLAVEVQPMRNLPVGNDEDLPHPRGKLFQGPDRVAELVVVGVPVALHGRVVRELGEARDQVGLHDRDQAPAAQVDLGRALDKVGGQRGVGPLQDGDFAPSVILPDPDALDLAGHPGGQNVLHLDVGGRRREPRDHEEPGHREGVGHRPVGRPVREVEWKGLEADPQLPGGAVVALPRLLGGGEVQHAPVLHVVPACQASVNDSLQSSHPLVLPLDKIDPRVGRKELLRHEHVARHAGLVRAPAEGDAALGATESLLGML